LTSRSVPEPRRDSDEATHEHWSAREGPVDVLALDIPPDSARSREFDIDCRMVVKRRVGPDGQSVSDASHGLRVYVNGSLAWSRTVPTHGEAGQTDSLDFHVRHTAPAGRPLRVIAMSEVNQATRVSLSIDAEES
jgi:hypothetical protein